MLIKLDETWRAVIPHKKMPTAKKSALYHDKWLKYPDGCMEIFFGKGPFFIFNFEMKKPPLLSLGTITHRGICLQNHYIIYFRAHGVKQGVKRSENLQGTRIFRFGPLFFSQN